jgi:hypothetical protein
MSVKLKAYEEHGQHVPSPVNSILAANDLYVIDGYISLKDQATVKPPEHVPETIAAMFREAATCVAVQCWNAAGAMFRSCVDLATKPMLPPQETPNGPNAAVRRNLGLRLPWLFDSGKLPEALRELSGCIHQDGNDGAHDGTLTKEDAFDLQDFTQALLERLYTEPARLQLAAERRTARRAQPAGQ